jgi:hypothetical protein
MGVDTVRVLAGYTQVGQVALAQESIIRNVSFNDGMLPQGAVSAKVYVHALSTIQDYVPGTGVTPTEDGSDYVTVSNLKDEAINEIMDGLSVEAAYNSGDYVAKRYDAAIKARGEKDDTNGFTKMVADGTELVAAAAAKPTVDTIYQDILNLKAALDTAKAPRSGRYLILSSEMENLLLSPDAKVIIAEPSSKLQQVEGSVGRLLGFDIFSTVLLPAGTNIIAGHPNAFYFKDIFRHEARIVSLDGDANHVGDSALKQRLASISGAVRPTLLQINNGAA